MISVIIFLEVFLVNVDSVILFHAALEDAHFIVYEDEREVIATNVSTCGFQSQSNKSKVRSNEVLERPSHHIEHTITHDKTLLTRTFNC